MKKKNNRIKKKLRHVPPAIRPAPTSFFYDVNNTYSGVGTRHIGLTSQLRILNFFIEKAKAENRSFHPRLRINGIDVWNTYFMPPIDYSVYVNAISWPNADKEYSQKEEQKTNHTFKENIRFNDNMNARAKKVLEDLGSPKVAISIRETDKVDGEFCALPSSVYVDTAEKLEPELFLVIGDCNITINELQKLQHARWLGIHRSPDCMPIHRLLNHPLNHSRNVNESIIIDELLLEVACLLRMNRVFYGIPSGVILWLQNVGVKTEWLWEQLTSDQLEWLKYFHMREKFFWSIIDHDYRTCVSPGKL